MAQETIEFKIDADTREALIAVSRFTASLSTMKQKGEGAATAAQMMSQRLTVLGTNLSRLSGGLRSAGTALTVGLTLPIVALGLAAIKMGSQLQVAEVGFTTLTGSARVAGKLLENLKEFAATTPFQFTDLLEASKRMLALGFAAKDIIPNMRMIGDQVAALGGGAPMINRIVLALGQMNAKTKVQAQDMRQLTEAGIPAWQSLADAIGVSVNEAMDMSEKRMIEASVAIPAILAGMRERTEGQMELLSQTVVGKFSNMLDRIGFIMQDFGKVLTPIAFDVLDVFEGTILPSINKVVKAFSEMDPGLRNMALGFAATAASIGPFLIGLALLVSTLASALNIIALVVASETGMAIAVGIAGTAFSVMAVAILAAGAAFAGWRVGQWIARITGLDRAVGTLNGTIEQMEEATKADMESTIKLAESLNKMGVFVNKGSKSFDEWRDQLIKTGRSMKEFSTPADEVAANIAALTEKMNQLKTAGGGVLEVLDPMKAKIELFENPVEEFVFGLELMTATLNEFKDLTKDSQFMDGMNKSIDEFVKSSSGIVNVPFPDTLEDWFFHQKLFSGALDDTNAILPEVIEQYNDMTAEQLRAAAATEEGARILKMFDDNAKEVADTLRDNLSKEVSTVFTDLSKGIAEAIVEWRGMWDTFQGIAKSFATSILRLIFDQLLTPLLGALKGAFSGKGFDMGKAFSGFGGIASGIGGLFGGGGGAAAGATAVGGFSSAAGASGGFSTALGAGGAGAGGAAGGGFSSAIMATLTNPLTIAIGGAIAAGFVIWKKFIQKDAFESGAKEVGRDFGVAMGKGTVDSFVKTLNISKKQFEGIRKDILSSPKFLEEVLIPSAKASGSIETLINKFRKLETVMGTVDLSGPLREAIESGDFTEFNKQWFDLFKQSKALVAVFGNDIPTALFGTEKAIEEVIADMENLIAKTGLTEEFADTFMEGFSGIQASMEGIPQVAANLAGQFEGLVGFLQGNGLTALDSQIIAWGQFGGKIIDTFNSMTAMGIDIPPFIQQLIDWGLANDRVILSSNGLISVLNVEIERFKAIAREAGLAGQAVDDFANSAGAGVSILDQMNAALNSVVNDFNRFVADFKDSLSLVDLQNKAWDQFGGRILSVIGDFAEFGITATDLSQNFRDLIALGIDMGKINIASDLGSDFFSNVLSQTSASGFDFGHEAAVQGVSPFDLPGFDKAIQDFLGVSDDSFLNRLFGDIPALAEGGIVTKPTLALVGESGPEAVVPLGQMNNSKPNIEVHIHGDVLSEIDFERKIGEATSRIIQGGGLDQAIKSAIN